MLGKLSNMCLTVMPLVLLIAMSAPSYPVDNATIAGDGVRVRELPSATGEIQEVLNKGTRVEVNGVFNFSETINGYTAPWYGITHGDVNGFVFGQFIALDAGASVPPMEDPITYFGATGLYMFGGTESEVIKKLGEPVPAPKRSTNTGSSSPVTTTLPLPKHSLSTASLPTSTCWRTAVTSFSRFLTHPAPIRSGG